MASCPFRRSSSHVIPSNGALKRAFTVRQCSIQISNAEETEGDDKNTLNLKHLSAAILLLTAPSVSFLKVYSLYLIFYFDFLISENSN